MTDLAVPQRFEGLQYREADIEHVDPDEGTILMRAAPYDIETQLDRELWESFAPKTFERSVGAPHRVKCWHEHGGPLIGHAADVEDRPDGIWIKARISNTPSGQEARELARDGTLDQCSVTFRPMKDFIKVTQKRDGVHVRHSRAYLLGVALVAHGAYAEHAMIASVRSEVDAQRDYELRKARLLGYTH
jgi:HK97 family phage prohead protease